MKWTHELTHENAPELPGETNRLRRSFAIVKRIIRQNSLCPSPFCTCSSSLYSIVSFFFQMMIIFLIFFSCLHAQIQRGVSESSAVSDQLRARLCKWQTCFVSVPGHVSAVFMYRAPDKAQDIWNEIAPDYTSEIIKNRFLKWTIVIL